MSRDISAELASYLAPVLPIVQQFVDGAITGEEFEDMFFAVYPNLDGHPAEDVFLASEHFWTIAEAHVADVRLREPGGPTTGQLRAAGEKLLRLAGM